MSVRVADAVAGLPLSPSPAVPSTSHLSEGTNGTNQVGGTDQVLLWM